MVRSHMSQQENQINVNSNNTSSSMDAEILEQGDIYFFYRPKKGAEEVKGIEDVRRFFMVTAPEQEENNNNSKSQLYRLFVIGKKSLPEIERAKLGHLKDIGLELVAFLQILMSLQKIYFQMNLVNIASFT